MYSVKLNMFACWLLLQIAKMPCEDALVSMKDLCL